MKVLTEEDERILRVLRVLAESGTISTEREKQLRKDLFGIETLSFGERLDIGAMYINGVFPFELQKLFPFREGAVRGSHGGMFKWLADVKNQYPRIVRRVGGERHCLERTTEGFRQPDDPVTVISKMIEKL